MSIYEEVQYEAQILRLVHSGFLSSANWDREFESTRKGWPIMLRLLRYGLTHHAGTPGRQAWFFVMKNMPIQDAWNALAEALKGNQVVYSETPEELCIAWNQMGDGLLYAALGSYGGATGISVNPVLYGGAIQRLPEATEYWQKEMDRILAPAAASSGA